MSRIRNAWRALMGDEPEVRVEKETVTETLLGTPEEVTIYRVFKSVWVEVYGHAHHKRERVFDYTTCEQAHAEHPGLEVQAVKVYRVGRVYVEGLRVTRLDVKKPKRAKGAK